MKHLFITGATGNIGYEVTKHLSKSDLPHEIFVGVRDVGKASALFKDFSNLNLRHFDFENPDTYSALSGMDRVFLLRPPHLSNIEKNFRPLLEYIKKSHIRDIVFLSVQGAEKSKVIPHNKIEQLIKDYGLNHIFLRPSYFMQNLTTTLLSDIQTKREIILPAGSARFNWVDADNIGELGALLLDQFEIYKNQALEITGYENKNFQEVTHLINEIIRNPLRYRNINPFRFYRMKHQEGMPKGMIMVMILLHFLPRFQKEPEISSIYERLTHKKPGDLGTFIRREKSKLDVL
ncbi:NmrA family NAD(P)-binding protein [Geofilum rubicundum]|uniref:NmrA-like domain-containing protein n=1 Tax=Geofilum rubicundum JCM 15548 TaxID=1236989 RepID=A0A0E9LXE2_9BACT|nr:NmrA family NAD(P)-binding protein [Geofilum rubicundum]GAO29530.1 hypothetical protein JCM15548_11727 [Geofilum rubicundum JCM 15548]